MWSQHNFGSRPTIWATEEALQLSAEYRLFIAKCKLLMYDTECLIYNRDWLMIRYDKKLLYSGIIIYNVKIEE